MENMNDGEVQICEMICEIAATRNTYPQLVLEAIKLSDDQKYDNMNNILKDWEAKDLSEAPNNSAARTADSVDKMVNSSWFTSRTSLVTDIANSNTHYDDIKSYFSSSSRFYLVRNVKTIDRNLHEFSQVTIMQEYESSCAWICPNDRHLALRAKLRSGWSVRSDQTTGRDGPEYTSEELKKIQSVISKAARLEEFEQERIGSLVDKLDVMKKNSMGDGLATCVLCAEQFGKFLGNVGVVCADCKKKVCNKCCVDYHTGARPTNGKRASQGPTFQWLCKICSEDRELWKRSGAWFFRALPQYKLPPKASQSMQNKRHLHTQSQFRASPLATRRGLDPDSPASRNGHGNSLQPFHWEKPTKPKYTSSSEDVESSDDDGITLGRVKKANSQASDSLSITSSTTSATSFDKHTLSPSPSPAARRKLSSRRTRRVRRMSPRTPPNEPDRTSLNEHVTDSPIDNSRLPVDMSNLHSGSNGHSHMEAESTEQVNYRGIDSRGSIEFCITYDSSKCSLHISIIRAQNLIGMDSNGLSDPYVKLHLLPGMSRVTKLRTKTRNKTLNPVFNEMLTYLGILEHELPKRKLLLTVLDEDTFGHDFIGEIVVPLLDITPNNKKSFNMPLKVPYTLTEAEKIPPDSGRIHIGLCYNMSTHLLMVKIHRCAYLVSRKKDQETVNAFVKATLSLDDRRTMVQKTEVKKKTQNPKFDRELKFQVSPDNGQAELARGTLDVAVLHKDSIGHDTIGIVKFGIKSSGNQLKQWFSCLKHADQQYDGWHILSLETSKKTKKKS